MEDVVDRITHDCQVNEPRVGRKETIIATLGALLVGRSILVDSKCWESGKTGVALGVLSETVASFAFAWYLQA